MAESAENFWQALEKVQESTGATGALIFVSFFAFFYIVIIFLAAWAVSATFGSAYWMTFLCILLLKFALK